MINLTKGQKVDLTKDNPGLKKLIIGLGWDVNNASGGDFDLDASAFLLDANGKATEKNFVYFGNKTTDGVKSTGDNLTGAGDGDDEQLIVALDDVKEDIQKIVFAITIYNAENRNQNFGQVSNAYVRVVNEETKEEVLKYDLSEDFSVETAVVTGELYRHNGEWKFAAIGTGFTNGLKTLTDKYVS